MTRDRDDKPRSELEIVRIGGGASARLVALVVVGVLAAVVWVGMSNRPPVWPMSGTPRSGAEGC